MFNRKAIVAALVIGTVAVAAPAPASAGLFNQIIGHAVKKIAMQAVKRAERQAIRSVIRSARR